MMRRQRRLMKTSTKSDGSRDLLKDESSHGESDEDTEDEDTFGKMMENMTLLSIEMKLYKAEMSKKLAF
jgi:hypothetical protein